MDINRVWIVGEIITSPFYLKKEDKVPFTSFILKSIESYADKNGNLKTVDNLIDVEGLGKVASQIINDFEIGDRVSIDGYIRCDGSNPKMRIRVYAINKDPVAKKYYIKGLEKASTIVKNNELLLKEIADERRT